MIDRIVSTKTFTIGFHIYFCILFPTDTLGPCHFGSIDCLFLLIDWDTGELLTQVNTRDMATHNFLLTNKKLDTVETGIAIVKEKVGIVDNRLVKMADGWRSYDSRLHELEQDLHKHDHKMGEIKMRNDTHSAKLRALEEELMLLKGGRGSRTQDVYEHRSPMPQHDNGNFSPRYYTHDVDRRNLEFQRENKGGWHRDIYRDQMHGPDTENRYNTKHWEKRPHDYEESSSERKMRLDLDKVDLHDGNFKPWNGRDVHYKHAHVQPALTGGVYLFIRTNKDALVEVRKALQESRTVLANSGGQLKGIAHADQITLLEGRPDGWMCRPSTQPGKDFDILNIVSVFWFESLHRAERWLHYESKFKTSSFPEPDGADVFAAPINFIPKEGDVDGTTYLMTEYREVRDVDQFREQFVAPMRRIFHNFGIQDFVMNTVGVKCFRGQWAKPRSIVTVNRFRDSEAAERFFFHPEYVRLRTQLKDMTRGRSSVLFNLVEKVV